MADSAGLTVCLFPESIFLSLGNKKKSQGSGHVNKVDGLKLSPFQKPKKRLNNLTLMRGGIVM